MSYGDFDPTDWNGTGHLWEPEPEPASELEEWNVFCRVANSYRGRFCDSDDEPDFEDALVDGLSPAPPLTMQELEDMIE